MVITVNSLLKSGLAAGLAINVSAGLMVPWVGDSMTEALAARGLPPMGVGAMVYFGTISLALGVVLVWLYAALLPVFGSGLKAAMLTPTLVWFLAYFQANTANAVFGFIPADLAAIGTAWGLVELLVACAIGARLCRADLTGARAVCATASVE